MSALRLGTRGSPLALWQTRQVAAALRRAGGPEPELVTITTDGDRFSAAHREAPMQAAGGKRLFVKAIEDALLAGEIDLAVHSAKDLPADLPEGLRIDAVLPREDPHDALAAPAAAPVAAAVAAAAPTAGAAALVAGAGPRARVGTSSIRRAAQLRRAFPGIEVVPVRGNVGTRLRRLDEGRCDFLVLAVAGLVRLGLRQRITSRLEADVCVPAPGQGIVAAECRSDDASTRRLVRGIRDPEAARALDAERALVTALGADCNVPLGALATGDGHAELSLDCVVASADGRRLLRHAVRGSVDDPVGLGRRAADLLLADGAEALLAAARAT